jgi:hypothetical protein
MLLIRSDWRYRSSLRAGIFLELPHGQATDFKGLNADAPEKGRMLLIRSDWRKRFAWRVGLLGHCRSGCYGRESEPCAETNKKKKITARQEDL